MPVYNILIFLTKLVLATAYYPEDYGNAEALADILSSNATLKNMVQQFITLDHRYVSAVFAYK